EARNCDRVERSDRINVDGVRRAAVETKLEVVEQGRRKGVRQRNNAVDRIGRKLLLFIEILPGAWGIREKVVGFVDVGPPKKIGRVGEAIIQAEHPRVFLAYLIPLPHELGNVRVTGRVLPVGIGVDDGSKLWQFRQHLLPKSRAGYITDKSLAEVLPVAFVGDKEKGLIPDDGSAQSPSELIQVEGRLVVWT